MKGLNDYNMSMIMKVVVTAIYYVEINYKPKDAFIRAVYYVRLEYPLSKEEVDMAYGRFGYKFNLDERDWNYMMGWGR